MFWKKALFSATLSAIAISGSSVAGYYLYQHLKSREAADSKALIQAIVHTTSQTETAYLPLPASFFAETLGLSADVATPLSSFDLNEAKNRLLATHFLKGVEIMKLKPNALFIHYTAKTPLLLLQGETNTALDEEGSLFPYAPYYSSRRLPSLYLGERVSLWGERLSREQLETVKCLLHHFGEDKLALIDLSQVAAPSSGQREIIVKLQNGILLRLAPKNLEEQLIKCSFLYDTFLFKNAHVIDLRLANFAYIRNK